MTPLGRRFWAWLVTIAMVAAGISACAAHAAVSKSPAAATGNAKSLAGSTGDEGWYSRDQATQGATLFGQSVRSVTAPSCKAAPVRRLRANSSSFGLGENR